LDIEDTEDEEDLKEIKQYLNRATQDEEMIRMLELEEDIGQEFEKLETELELARQGKEEERKEKEKECKEKLEAQKREKEALQTISKMVKQLYGKGVSVSEIASLTGKSEDEIKTILN
jgi:hypothetical protein